MKLKQILLVVAISATSAIGSVWTYGKLTGKNDTGFVQSTTKNKLPDNYKFAGIEEGIVGNTAEPIDFTKAAQAAVPAVVHIKTKIPARKISNNLPRSRGNTMDDWFNDFFEMGPRVQPEQRASGSGVIISEDGYIVTNNHVVSNGGDGVADEITVTMASKKTYKAKVIGRDPSSDLAVLKIDATNLPYMIYGNSDNLKLGQWVLAIGYPLSLETTVTAGIVSAKGRRIGINDRQSDTPIESFIQTDAAINQGNSGGALITTEGQLVGINSAILAPNGTYAGYGFSIPVNLVKKIVNDLIKFGDVKRPYLGISANDSKLEAGDGAHVGLVAPDGAAAEVGIKRGDIITKINDISVGSWAELQGTIASYNAGDKVKITYRRNGSELTGTATLKAKTGTYDEVAKTAINEKLGANLETLSKEKAKQYEINGGVVVKSITSKESPIGRTRIQEGFIITSVNGADIVSIEQLSRVIARAEGNIRLEGIYPGYDGTYTYPLNVEEDEQ
jgi:serine protease Do